MENISQNSFNHLMSLAQRSHQKADLPMAINLYKEALKSTPKQPVALQNLGIAYCSLGDFDNGIFYLEKALDIQSENPILLINLSNAYLRVDSYLKALPLLQKAIFIKPDFDEAYNKLGNALKALNNIDEAVIAYKKAIELNPNQSSAYYNWGNAMMHLGNYTSAINCYEKSLQIKPDFDLAHNNLGIALVEWDRLEEAEQHYKCALHINPTFKESIKNICQLYEKAGKETLAKHWRNELLKLNPSDVALKFNINTKSNIIYENKEAIVDYQLKLTTYLNHILCDKPEILKPFIENDCYPSSDLIYQGKVIKEIKELFAKFYSQITTHSIETFNQKCHVGFLVTSGHEGVFLKCMRGILNNINTTKFKVSVVCSTPNGERIIKPQITNPDIEYVGLPKDFIQAQQTILIAKIDILHYWEIGTDSTNYFLALTKLAPIQITSWGWPTTSGLKSIDYYISQKDMEPKNGQENYTEKLILFDKMPVYYYRPPVPENIKPLSSYGLYSKHRLYICQQNLRKVHPDFDTLIASLLENDKEGIVLFIKDKQEEITNQLMKRMSRIIGPNFIRVKFLDRMKEEDYLGLLSQCTVVLDTLYYGGGANTIYDSIEVGIPVITLEGDNHSGRFASAVFKQMGIEDTIVHTTTDYVQTAIKIASNQQYRMMMVQKIKTNSKSMFEDISAVRELECFFDSVFKQ